MRRSYILAAIALVAAGIAAFLMFGQNGFGREAKPTPVRDSSGKTAPAKVTKTATPRTETKKPAKRTDAKPPANRAAATDRASDEALAKLVNQALKEERPNLIVDNLAAIMASPDPEVRQDAVEALAWFGERYLGEMLGFVSDEDEEVREAARNACETFISEIEDEGAKVKTIEFVTKFATDKVMLDCALAALEDLKDSVALNALYNVILNGTSAAKEAAKRQYKMMTGVEYSSFVELRKRQIAAKEREAAEDADE